MLEVEDGQVPVRREDGLPLAVGPLVHHGPAGLGAHPGVLEHRRQVDLVHVVVPVDHAGVELETGVIVAVARLPQLDQVVDAVRAASVSV